MILGIDQIGIRIKEQYDKVIAVAVVLLLLVSLVYLGVKVTLIQQMQAEFDAWLRSRHAANPHAEVIAPDVYNASHHSLAEPFQINYASWTNVLMFVPETRFNCRACRLPVNIDAAACPFCDTEVEPPEAPNADADGDGMPTDWEERYNLDPFDPTDAEKDNDNDGYSNLVEYKEGYDPTDPESHPPASERLTLKSITGKSFGLRFNSRVRTKSGYKFGLNYRLPSGETKTDFAEIGDTVAGFTLTKYEEKKAKVEKPFPHTADVSELTLTTAEGEVIILVKGKARLHVELTAHLVLTLLDGSLQNKMVTEDEIFDLEGIPHKVIAIDVGESRVVIRDERSGREIVVQGSDAGITEATRE